jgi:hypothetical protein
VTSGAHSDLLTGLVGGVVAAVVFVAEARGWLDHPFRRSWYLTRQWTRHGPAWLRPVLLVVSPVLLLLLESLAASATFIKWVLWVFYLIRWGERLRTRPSRDRLPTTPTE